MEAIYPSRKEHIIHVAQSLFRRNGYTATSMRNLAAELGIEAASIYSHIRSKEEILQEICFGMADVFFEKLQLSVLKADEADERLKHAIIGHVEVITQNIDAAAVFFHDWRYMGENALSNFKTLRYRYENMFRHIVKEGIVEAKFKAVDEKFIVLTIFSAMNWTYEWYKPESGMQAEEIGNNIANIIINGIKEVNS